MREPHALRVNLCTPGSRRPGSPAIARVNMAWARTVPPLLALERDRRGGGRARLRRRNMNFRRLWIALAPFPAIGIAVLAACSGSEPVGGTPDAGTKTRDEGPALRPRGENERFRWDEITVTDKGSNLVWLRSAEPGWVTWDEARARCASLGSGWRLP